MKEAIELILARVLVDTVIAGVNVLANQLVSGPKEVVEHHCKNGDLDKSAGAVKYCQKNEAKVVSLVAESEPVEVTDEAIVAAIRALDDKNKDLWTAKGVPKTEAIEAELGVEKGTVRAADRNAAWQMIQDEEA